MDKGTEDKVVDVVQNLVCHLKKGYMIVKCRGQQDIQENLCLTEALQREKAFFEDHPQFRYSVPPVPRNATVDIVHTGRLPLEGRYPGCV